MYKFTTVTAIGKNFWKHLCKDMLRSQNEPHDPTFTIELHINYKYSSLSFYSLCASVDSDSSVRDQDGIWTSWVQWSNRRVHLIAVTRLSMQTIWSLRVECDKRLKWLCCCGCLLLLKTTLSRLKVICRNLTQSFGVSYFSASFVVVANPNAWASCLGEDREAHQEMTAMYKVHHFAD